MRTPHDRAALIAERENRHSSEARSLRRARRQWMEHRYIVAAYWVESEGDEAVRRLENGQATAIGQVIAAGRRDY